MSEAATGPTESATRDPRESMLLLATLRVPDVEGGHAWPLRIRNLSAGGLMGETDLVLVPGSRVETDLRGIGWVAGLVAWAGGGRIGIAFDLRIDPKATRKPVGTGAGTSKILVAPTTRRPGLRTL